MVTLGTLIVPIILSAVLVFVASSIIHMVLRYHNPDYRKLPDEEAVRTALRGQNPPPGQYIIPHCPSMKEMNAPEFQQKWKEGPVGVMYLRAPGVPSIGPQLMQWFLLTLVISLFCAYIAAVALPAGTPYLTVFRIVGSAALLGYGGSVATESIWMGRPWRSTWKHLFDALIYALLTAGVFGWRWPGA